MFECAFGSGFHQRGRIVLTKSQKRWINWSTKRVSEYWCSSEMTLGQGTRLVYPLQPPIIWHSKKGVWCVERVLWNGVSQEGWQPWSMITQQKRHPWHQGSGCFGVLKGHPGNTLQHPLHLAGLETQRQDPHSIHEYGTCCTKVYQTISWEEKRKLIYFYWWILGRRNTILQLTCQFFFLLLIST